MWDKVTKFDPLSKKITFVVLLLVIILSIFLRTVKITDVPPGLYQDESAIGYNAYSILQIGKDEYGESYPLYFTSFGDHKLPVYIYLTSISIKLFGLNEFAVRFPSILAGIAAIVLVFLLIQYLTKNATLSLLTASILALNPIHVFFSRAAFEVNLALTFALAGCYFFVLGATRKNFYFLLASLISFGLCLYSYNVTRLIAPLFLIGLVIMYWKQLKEFSRSLKMGAFVVLGLILFPFLQGFLSASGVFSATSTLITGPDILVKDLEFRSYLLSLPHWYSVLFYNKYIFMLFQYLQNIASILSGSFFFVSGTTEQNQGIGNVGFFYLVDFPFFILGIIIYFRAKIKAFRIFFLWLIASVCVLALSKEVPHATRGYFLVLPIVCFIALGYFSFFYFLSTYKNKLLKPLFALILLFGLFYNVQFYFLSYYFRFPTVYADAWRSQDKELSQYLKVHEGKYDKIIIDPSTNFIYTSYLFYDAYPPQKFINTVTRHKDGNLTKAYSWGKYTIDKINWGKDLKIPRTLLITTEANTPTSAVILKKFYTPETHSYLTVDDTIVNASIKSVKYVLIETDVNITSNQ